MRITVIDCDTGNIGSVRNMLDRVGAEVEITGDPDQVQAAEKLILPGVGAFDHAMAHIRVAGLIPAIHAVANRGAPLLGVCLGMQLLGNGSEEGELDGLGLIEGNSRKFDFSATTNGRKLAVPHMGWTDVEPVDDSELFFGLKDEARFYFAHSYFFQCADDATILASADYGGRFTCAIRRKNVYGVQFHPEKSHRFGMRLLENFVNRC